LQEGEDLTLISWGASIHETQQAAQQLKNEGISCDVIDVASIKPLDIETIINSVTKTGRCVIVHEGAKTGGVGAEISAQLMENCLPDLLAPVQRVTGYDVVMPYFQLEKYYIPSVKRIKDSVMSIME
jgi:2-oxoisovalerate dehydrogenase E1 component beta subunit